MRLAIFALRGDPLADHTRTLAETRGHEVRLIEPESLIAGPFSSRDDGWWLGEERLLGFDAFIVRHFPRAHSLPALPADTEIRYAEWFQFALQQRERAALAESCLMDLERSARPIINPPLASGPYDYKPYQLACFRRAGFPTPKTLITHSAEEALRFEAELGVAVMKPVEGGAIARRMDRALIGSIDLLPSPSIFQELIEGTNIRATTVGSDIASVVEIPSEDLDYRDSVGYRAGNQRYEDHALPSDVAERCVAVARLFHYSLAGIDLIRRPSGEYVFIEANSAPVYLDIEVKTGAPITATLIDHLAAATTS